MAHHGALPQVLLGVAVAGAVGIGLLVVRASDETPLAAELTVVAPAVDVDDGAGYGPAATGDPVSVDDRVRTDTEGRAQLDFIDGSLARLGPGTKFTLTELESDAGERRVSGELDVGTSWHRVKELTGTDAEASSYEVETAVAVAAVRGTAFAVACPVRRTCTFSVVDGTVEVTAIEGGSVTLSAGQVVTVDGPDIGEVRTFSPDELLSDPWLRSNVETDALPDDGQAILDGGWDVELAGDEGPTVSRRYVFTVTECDEPPCPLHATIGTAAGDRTVPVDHAGGTYSFTTSFPLDCGTTADALDVTLTARFRVTEVGAARSVPRASELTGTIDERQVARRPSECAATDLRHDLRAVRS